MSRCRCFRFMAATFIVGLVGYAPAHGQTAPPTSVTVSGGSQGASQRLPEGQPRFGLRVPLKPNADNLLSLTALDDNGRTATIDNIRVAQLSLTEIVRARVTAQRLSTPEIRQLVADGVIDVADPDNYNVSRFVVALTVGGQQVEVPVPVVRERVEPFGAGPAISVGCGQGPGIQTTERSISIPCGGGSGGSAAKIPDITIIPFEIVVPDLPVEVTVPGVILIEGRIKTLKEFFKVNLLLMNVSPIFSLTDLTATLELPEGALTGVAPATGTIAIPDIAPDSDRSGEFIIRGDRKGIHTIVAHFGGKITGSFLPGPVEFSGSASTDLEVKGPPKMAVKLQHPDFVTAREEYDLVVEITNTDSELDALYTTLAIDVSAGAELIDETTGQPSPGATIRTLGDIPKGTTIVQRYRVMSLVTGAITSCVGAASENLSLTMDFIGPGREPRCAIGTLPSERANPDGRPTVTVVPTHNTVGVAFDPAITAIFSAPMIEQTITTGYAGASFRVVDPDNVLVDGTLQFTTLFDATAAIFRPLAPLRFGKTYTIVVEENIFDREGHRLASGVVARFTTEDAPYVPDTTLPTVTLSMEAPFAPTNVARGQQVAVLAASQDNQAVTRLELLLNGALIDTRRPEGTVRFIVDTSLLAQGSSHVVSALAYDAAGNVGAASFPMQIAPDVAPPLVTLDVPSAVARGRRLAFDVMATDDARVARVDVFVDGAPVPAATQLIGPYRFALETASLSVGTHTVRAEATDGAGNVGTAQATVSVTGDLLPPQITLIAPQPGTRVRAPGHISFTADATDNVAVATMEYRLDAETVPRRSGMLGLSLATDTLAVGLHVMTIRATDTSGNAAELPVPFEVFTAPPDDVPPAVPTASLISVGPPTGSIVSIVGADGAVEGGARVRVTTIETQAGATTVSSASGAFAAQIEASGGQTLSLVAIDDAGNRSGALTIVVPRPVSLTSIIVTPSSLALNRQQPSAQLTVTGTFSDNTQRPLSSGLTFASSAPAVVSATMGGLLLPGQNGAGVITVATDTLGVAPVVVPVTVNFTTTTRLLATPNPLTFTGLGQSRRIGIAARFSDDTTGAFSGVARFATANANVAVVDAAGLVTSTGLGSTTISIASAGLPTETVQVTVEGVQPTALVVTPNSVALTSLGQTETLSVRYDFSDGTSGPGNFPVSFTSREPRVATVSSAGVITASGEGSTLIDVSSLTFTTAVSISVAVPSAFPPPVITGLGRPIAGEGDTLAIFGRNFAGAAALNVVTVNGLRAEVIGSAFDRLIVTVPYGATTGAVVVRVGGQDSNAVPVDIYGRRARAILTSTAFAAPGTQVADLGSATVVLQPGDAFVVAGDPHLIPAPRFTTLSGPSFVGTLAVTLDGVERVISGATQPVDLSVFLGPIAAPRSVTVSARLESAGGQLSSQGLAFIAGPPNTGALVGERFSLGDAIGERTVLRFRLNAPDGTRVAATAVNWYRLDGSYGNGSVGGTIVDGILTPNDANFRTFTVQGGEITVTYDDAGVLADFAGPREAVVALVSADANGNRTGFTPVAEARVLIGALDSASVLPQQASLVADGVDRPVTVDVNSVRDSFGNRVTDRTRLALTAANWYRRVDGGFGNGSPGGTLGGGDPTPNDPVFRTVTLAAGAAQLTYSAGSLLYSAGQSATTVLAAVVANAAGSRLTTRPFAEGPIALSSVSLTQATVRLSASQLSATSGDNRSVITLSGLTDANGRPLPDGSRIAVTAGNWYRASDGGFGNGSLGGTILGGDPVPNDGTFRSFGVSAGAVTFTYSNAGLVLDRGATATAVISMLPAAGNGNRIGTTPFADARITQGGISSATIVAAPSSTLADGTRRPIAVSVTNIRDALGNVVPDGTSIGLTAQNWYRRTDGGFGNNSAGGTFLDGTGVLNDAGFRAYSTLNGRVDATYSAETVAPLSPTEIRSAVISAVVVNSAPNRLTSTPFADGVVAVSAVETGTVVASPTTLLADRQDRRSTITITGLTDGQGRMVPDGTRLAITAVNWYRISDGGFGNGSVGGTMIDGMPSPNDQAFRSYTVNNGQLVVTYSSAGLSADTGATSPVVISILPATSAGGRIGIRPLAVASLTLAGIDTGNFIAPATVAPGSTTTVTLANMRDASGNVLPDGTRVAVTAATWYNRDGSFGNGSAGGALAGGTATPNDGGFRTYVVSGGAITLDFTAPGAANVTSVLSAVAADGGGNRITTRPFATVAIRAQ